jgi:toxin-antitoxin system PIN domain toxin
VKLIDVNVLLYAINADSEYHLDSKAWLEDTLSASERVALPWPVLLAFLRLATNKVVLRKALRMEQACAVVDAWLSRPNVVILEPGDEHWVILRMLLGNAPASRNQATDAHLAALAIEHGAELCSPDSDFSRFSGLRWTNPLTLPRGRGRR